MHWLKRPRLYGEKFSHVPPTLATSGEPTFHTFSYKTWRNCNTEKQKVGGCLKGVPPTRITLFWWQARSPFLSGQLFFILTVWLALSGHSWSQSSSVHDGQSQKRKHWGGECLSGQLDRSILIVGFICPPTIHFKFITKGDNSRDNFYITTKCDSLLLQSATAFYYKVREFYYKMR